MTDLATLDLAAACDAPFEFELTHPKTGDGVGVFFSIVGHESASFQTYLREQANKARRKMIDRRKDEIMTVEAETDLLVDAVVAYVKGWRTVLDGKSKPIVLLGGEELEFSEGNARRLLGNPGFAWAVRQISEKASDLGNFIAG